MLLVRMDPAVAHQSHQMQAARARVLHGASQNRVAEEFAGGDHVVDSGDVHVDDPAASDVEMADFAVAHLPVGEADIRTGRVDESVWEAAVQLVPGGLARQSNGVAVARGTESPTVQND